MAGERAVAPREGRSREARRQARARQARTRQGRREAGAREAGRQEGTRQEGTGEEGAGQEDRTPLTGWPSGAATGVGSLPGTDPAEAARVVAGELPVPHLPELPERGPGADMVGRTLALLPGLHADLQPAGWRLIPRPGVDERRALDYLAWDLDAVERAFDSYVGVFKVQVCGPWTLAATTELPRGDRALADRAAVRDLAAALDEAIEEHVADVRRRVPGADVVVQVDEPALPAVVHGRVPTASGFGALRTPDTHEIREVLPRRGIHCCAADVPFALLDVPFLSIDVSLVTDYDALAALVENGTHLLAGATDARQVTTLWRRLGQPLDSLAERVVVTPPCGLAGRSPDDARAAMTTAREIARRLAEAPEEQ